MSIILIILVFVAPLSRCSMVIDSAGQRGLFLSEYCPKMKYCPEGAHVMCMYYNPEKLTGPSCINYKNISMTSDLADHLLSVTNAVRSKISRGKEKGQGGLMLPRGYGIFKLKWDEELATFAQVLANQCILKHDLCRASKRFPDPGQAVGMVNFSFNGWFPVIKSSAYNFTDGGLTMEKVLYAMTLSLKTWYNQKTFVNSSMINNYPDWKQHPDQQGGRMYLEMIYGPSTHMGCGISGYSQYAFYDNSAALNYNSIQLICNYSAKPNKNGPVYNTLPPSDKEIPFSRCGCPIGSEADDDCLCNEKQVAEPLEKKCKGRNCEPTVVLLPIFTMEDAPPEKLMHFDHYRRSNTTYENEDKDIFKKAEDNYSRAQALSEYKGNQQGVQYTQRAPKPQNNAHNNVKRRYFYKVDQNKQHEKQYENRQASGLHKPSNKKMSIFARATTFMLPNARSKSNVIKDVVVRRDFASAKKLADKYIYRKSIIKKHAVYEPDQPVTETTSTNTIHFINVMPNDSSSPDNVGEVTQPTTSTFESQSHDLPIIDITDGLPTQTDNKLLNLLNTLEQEVKNVELRGHEKELFDTKIRNIYGHVVGKPVTSINLKIKVPPNDYASHIKELIENHVKNINDEHVNPPTTPAEVNKTAKVETIDEHAPSSSEYYKPHATNEHNALDDDPINKDRSRTSIYLNNDVDTNAHDIQLGLRKRKNYNSFDEKAEDIHDQIDDHQYRKVTFRGEKNEFDGRRIKMNDIERRDKRHRNYGVYERPVGEPLSMERRKYYQDKLDNIERRLNRVRTQKRRRFQAPNSRHMRAMVPSERKSENQMNPFYGVDHSRVMHSY